MTILAIDFMNAAHRARSGFKLGPAPVVFNFFRQFKSLVDKFQPNRVYLALEGKPVHRYEMMQEYKANRKVAADDPRAEELAKFFKQKDVIVDLLSKYFPVSVVRHPTSECDDTLANLIRRSSTAIDWVLVSSDTDFIQLLSQQPNLKLYNPVQGNFVQSPSYNYVTWKALRGDATDNIPGIPGCGDKTAAKLAEIVGTDEFVEYLSHENRAEIFERNLSLIRFSEWSDEERAKMTCSTPQKNWQEVKTVFENYGFNSMIKEEAWQKFLSTFDSLWT